MTEKFYTSNRVSGTGRPLYMTEDGRKLEEIKRIATELYLRGYHAMNYNFDHYWSEAIKWVNRMEEAEDDFWEEWREKRGLDTEDVETSVEQIVPEVVA